MNLIKTIAMASGILLLAEANAQQMKQPSQKVSDNYTVFNRQVTFHGGSIYLDAKAKDGLLWLNDSDFKNGTIELDIKGKDVRGKSFVGIAFHGLDNETFDAVYFRAFNFQNPDRNKHSLQYISMPENDWSVLRNAFPGKYENSIVPTPQPNDWLHAKIVINYPKVKVFVNGSKDPSLEINQISNRKHGKVGFWVGNGSDGWFKNLKVTSNK